MAQEAQHTMTNADIVNMAKSGVGDQTIILMIQKGTRKFDTSPDAVIELKKAGVSDTVLNAMLSASSDVATSTNGPQQSCAQFLDRVLASVGTSEKVMAVHSIRMSAKEIVKTATGSSSGDIELLTVFPSSFYFLLKQPTGLSTKAVFTPEFNYLTSGKMTTAIPASFIQTFQSGRKWNLVYISQHREQYSCVVDGAEKIGNLSTIKLTVRGEDAETLWNIDPTSGRLLRSSSTTAEGERSVTDFSNWQQADGIYVPFGTHSTNGRVTTDVTVGKYEMNPATDVSLFQPPSDLPAASVELKVLQSESVPYTVETNGGISTACNISGSVETSINSSTYGNTTSGTATSTPNIQMRCKSSDTTIRWTHVLNAMFVEASDGNDYIIACDRAWSWSKCTPLKAGDKFFARRTDKGFLVQSFNSKSKEQEETYRVLQSKSVRE
jgi:outer membrane lipoprotein-sorting protein